MDIEKLKIVRVECIQDNFYPAGPATITVGKTYDAIESLDKKAWLITNDFGVELSYLNKSRFVELTNENG